MIARRSPEGGFTLIETLVALAILAMSAVSLLGATEAHISRIRALETRAAAQWVAENYLAEVTLGLNPSAAAGPMNGTELMVSSAYTPTADPDLARIDIVVRDPSDGVDYVRLTGFIDMRTAENPGGGN